jgi:integrase
MKKQSRLTFRVTAFQSQGSGIRHVLTNKVTNMPMFASSIYEAHLAIKTESHNSRIKDLGFFAYMYTWAGKFQVELDDLLLNGVGLSQSHIRSYVSWLEEPFRGANGSVSITNRKSINANIITCSGICTWFIKQYSNPTEDLNRRALAIQSLVQFQKSIWNDALIKVKDDYIAPDLTDEEVAAIERFLTPKNRSHEVGETLAVRDYLFWRLAIEFGLRKGEILALRLEDCPLRSSPVIKIVRIEKRGGNYKDPRKNPPRPKTLSRELGFLFENTAFPKLINEYVSSNRYGFRYVRDKKVRLMILPHEFLIVSEAGNPLSVRAADDIAKKIRLGTGIDFHWHIARHAFFNRAYEGMASLKDVNERNIRKADILWWGGWENEKSLDIYTKRARADRARGILANWQDGRNIWSALN